MYANMRIFVPLIIAKSSMKRLLLEQKLGESGCEFHRRGGNHDIRNYGNGRKFPFARHSDINEMCASEQNADEKKREGIL